jgi:uncharacterized membrane protein
MNQMINTEPQQDSLKTVSHISYFLHLIVAVGAVLPGTQASVALLIVAFVIDLVKRDSAAGTWQESHFSWRIRTVIWAAALYLITAPLWLLFFIPGWIAWGIISIWFLYRIVRGWMNLGSGVAMPS